jgi:hypothetical protein
MSNRAIRRAAERMALKAAKREQKEQAQTQTHTMAAAADPSTCPTPANADFAQEEIEQNEAPSRSVSDARVAANRENAQKSTGPTTPEGKAKASLNALKNGLTGTTMLFANSDELTRYHVHVDSYTTQLQPVGPEESALVQSIADIRWKLNRIPGLEQAILASDSLTVIEQSPNLASPEADMMLELMVRRRNEKELRNLHLQENRLARRRERETAELLRLQAERRAKEEEALAEAAKATVLAKHRNQPLTQIPGLGFVFSEKRYATYMSRLTPAQRAKFLQEALAELEETPQTVEAAA